MVDKRWILRVKVAQSLSYLKKDGHLVSKEEFLSIVTFQKKTKRSIHLLQHKLRNSTFGRVVDVEQENNIRMPQTGPNMTFLFEILNYLIQFG